VTQLCSLQGTNWNLVLCFFDLVAAFTIFALMVHTTGRASWNGDPVGRWALVRRQVYMLVVFALFARAVFRAEPNLAAPWMEAATSIVIVCALVFFLLTRASGLVDQDRWKGFHRHMIRNANRSVSRH
jgi:hypothetical protein